MATMTLTIGANTKSWTISAGDVTRVIEAYKILYQNPALTNTQVFDKVAADFARELRIRVKSAEEKTVANAIVEITLT